MVRIALSALSANSFIFTVGMIAISLYISKYIYFAVEEIKAWRD
jgi:hypothetical protein